MSLCHCYRDILINSHNIPRFPTSVKKCITMNWRTNLENGARLYPQQSFQAACCHFNIDYEIKAQSMNEHLMVRTERKVLPVSLLLRGHEILITHNITEIVWEHSSPNHPETNCLMMMFHANENLSCLLLNTNKVNGQHYLAFKKKWPKRHYTGENYFFSKL